MKNNLETITVDIPEGCEFDELTGKFYYNPKPNKETKKFLSESIILLGEIDKEFATIFSEKVNLLPDNLDQLILEINTKGGEIDYTNTVVSKILELKEKGVHIIIKVVGQCSSAGLYLLSYADEIDYFRTNCVAHMGYYDTITGANIVDLQYFIKTLQPVTRQYLERVAPFLTANEIKQFLNGEEVFFELTDERVDNFYEWKYE